MWVILSFYMSSIYVYVYMIIYDILKSHVILENFGARHAFRSHLSAVFFPHGVCTARRCNTIPTNVEPEYPGDLTMERGERLGADLQVGWTADSYPEYMGYNYIDII